MRAPSMLELSLDGRTLAQPVVRPRFSTTNAQRGIAVAIVPMVAITLVLGLTNRYLQYPVLAAVYWGYLIAASMGVGLYWWVRRPASRFGPLLILFGVLAWVVSWQNANAPLAYDLGVLVEAPVFILTFYLFLAFPMGRLEPAAAHDAGGLDVEHADLGGEDDQAVGGHPVPARAQAVSVEHGPDHGAVGERDQRGAVPRLHHRGVELVEGAALGVHLAVVLPRLRDHHEQRVRQ